MRHGTITAATKTIILPILIGKTEPYNAATDRELQQERVPNTLH